MGKKYGQHFLVNQAVLHAIAETVFGLAELLGTDGLWEVGPGRGALTEHIIGEFPRVHLFEVDTGLGGELKAITDEHDDLSITRGDILETGPEQIAEAKNLEEILVVGNLPYYITSPILRLFFEEGLFPGGVFLIQREVAEKLESNATKKSYLWRLLNVHYFISVEVIVPPDAFAPPPDVSSAVITMIKTEPQLSKPEIARMKTFLDIVSGLKRKTLGKIAKLRREKLLESDLELPADILTKRIEELTREEMKNVVK